MNQTLRKIDTSVWNNGEELEVLTFDIAGETFAIEAVTVREILDLLPETLVPGARSFVGSVLNFRGRVIPLADIRLAFGMEARDSLEQPTDPLAGPHLTRIESVELAAELVQFDRRQRLEGFLLQLRDLDRGQQETEVAKAVPPALTLDGSGRVGVECEEGGGHEGSTGRWISTAMGSTCA